MRACENAPATRSGRSPWGTWCATPQTRSSTTGAGRPRAASTGPCPTRPSALAPDALLGLGDYQFEVPDAASYRDIYGPSWGRLRDSTIPALGNQRSYKVHDANTFRGYFGDLSGPATGYWATDLGTWRVIVLNSNCTTVQGGCARALPSGAGWTASCRPTPRAAQ